MRAKSVLLAHGSRERVHLLDRHRKAPAADRVHGSFRGCPDDAGTTVDGEEHPRIQERGSNQRHDGDEGLQRHTAVTDQPHVRLAADQLRTRATGNERVEARDRPAGDGDEHEREHLAAEERTGAVHERGERGHLDDGMSDDDGQCQQDHGAELEKGGQVIARREQQPHRQHRGEESVHDHEAGERQPRIIEQQPQLRLAIDPAAPQERRQNKERPKDRALEHPARPPQPQV